MAICIVVFAILVIEWIALALQSLAVKSVVEASSVVTLFITLPVIKIAPALQRVRTVLPRVIEVQRAVPSIPVAGIIITCTVTDLIAFLIFTLCYLASHCHFWSRCDISSRATWEAEVQDVAEEAIEAGRTDAVVVWGL